jgi:8-oxo-dGTP diphosphatase/2-hydroxy-dATP diphosphatase
MKKILTLCLVVNERKMLLGMKKRGFGVGRWNGFGGKLEGGESIIESAKRELNEEVGIRSEEMEKMGIFIFEFVEESPAMEVHLFKINTYSGEPAETEEMLPKWFDFDQIPYDEMWPDDKFWMPYFLNGKKFTGYFLFDKPSTKEYTSKILKQEIKEVKEL